MDYLCCNCNGLGSQLYPTGIPMGPAAGAVPPPLQTAQGTPPTFGVGEQTPIPPRGAAGAPSGAPPIPAQTAGAIPTPPSHHDPSLEMREPELGDFGLTAEEYLRYIRFEAMKEKVWYKVLVGAGVATWVGCGLTTGNWGLGFMVGIGACLGTAHVQGIFWGCAKRWHPLSGKVRLYEEADDAYGDAYIEAQEEAERAYKETQRRHEEALREAERNRQRTLQRYWMSLSGPQFERELGGLYQKLGYTVQFTPGSGDHGIDLMLKKDGKTTIVQCKRYNEPAGPAVVRELYGTLIHSRADQAILACTGGFTRGVIEFVRGLRVLGAIVALTSSAAAEGLGIHTA